MIVSSRSIITPSFWLAGARRPQIAAASHWIRSGMTAMRPRPRRNASVPGDGCVLAIVMPRRPHSYPPVDSAGGQSWPAAVFPSCRPGWCGWAGAGPALSVGQVCASELGTDAGPAQPADRLAVETVGGLALAQQCADPGFNP